MRKLFLLLVMVSGMTFAQDLTFSIGQVSHESLTETLQSSNEPVVSVGAQFDIFSKKNFVLGPEVRAFLTKGNSKYLPGYTGGMLTGYDNGKFRLVGGLGMINPGESAEHKNKDIEVFRGIFTSELGVGPVFVRGEWYTNLKTYFYSYTVQLGFRIKL